MKQIFIAVLLAVTILQLQAQNKNAIPLLQARFITGDSAAYSTANFHDGGWEMQQPGEPWQTQGHPDYHGYAWYRIHFNLSSRIKYNAHWKDSLRLFLAHINDVDDTYLNGELVGHTGRFPGEAGGYLSKWPAVREYHISLKDPVIRWDSDNVIAVRVFDGGGTGGIFMGDPFVDVLEKINGLSVQADNNGIVYNTDKAVVPIIFSNRFGGKLAGTLSMRVLDARSRDTISLLHQQLTIPAFEKKKISLPAPNRQGVLLSVQFTEASSGLSFEKDITLPYTLTPQAGSKPMIHGAVVTGVRPGHPFIYRIAATGRRPFLFSADALPAGLTLDKYAGVIKGQIHTPGQYTIPVTVSNASGKNTRLLTVKVGDTIACTPPMGWNSWNCWGTSVSDHKVRSSTKALIASGLTDHGWNYINVDDGWQADRRATTGVLAPNKKFPDMKALADFVHAQGFRFGMYSSPGTRTCGGFPGSYGHELQDAGMFGDWGVDYLKYDLCNYIDSMRDKLSLPGQQAPFKRMQAALQKQQRDIVFSVCQYGLQDVWKWGRQVGGNLWRTTEDIEDTWQSLYATGFKADTLYPYAGPGGWNDPDMLTVGMVGWGENLHPSRLSADEQYTQLSLWSMLSAPLLIGCDISRLDRFTLNLLTNDEVIAIDQDPSGRPAKKILDKDSVQVWVKDLSGGGHAIAIFNISTTYRNYHLDLRDAGLKNSYSLRDNWRQRFIGTGRNIVESLLSPHGVYLFTAK